MIRILYMIAAVACMVLEGCKGSISGDFQPGMEQGSISGAGMTVPHELTVRDYAEWCNSRSSGLLKEQEVAGLDYRLRFLPGDYMALLELRSPDFSGSQFQQARQGYEHMSYFTLKMQLKKGEGELLRYELRSPEHYDARVKYISFGMQSDICLIQGKDTIHPDLYHFERTFEVTPTLSVLFAYDNRKFDDREAFTIVFDDELFEKGHIKFGYGRNQLTNLPNIAGI